MVLIIRQLSSDKLEQLYDELLNKLMNSIYAKRLATQAKFLDIGKPDFIELSTEDKCILLAEILHLFQCNSQASDLSLLNGPKRAGILKMNNDITKLEKINVYNQSITGFYEQVIDLQTI